MRILRKLFFLVVIISVFYYAYPRHISPFLGKHSPQTKKVTDNVLGTASKFTHKQASQSARFLDTYVFKQATKPFIEQYKKLPANKQEEIKKQICR